MPIAARIKFKKSLPFKTEHKLVKDRGFYVYGRSNDFVVLAKSTQWKPRQEAAKAVDAFPFSGLSNDTVIRLRNKCEAARDVYVDWETWMPKIRADLERMADNLSDELEAEFVRYWSYNNII